MSRTQSMDVETAERHLGALGLGLGKWNELCATNQAAASPIGYAPPTSALELYVASSHAAKWLEAAKWVIVQIDNSTWPQDDEVAVFEVVMCLSDRGWNYPMERTFMLEAPDVEVRLSLLIQTAAMFGWHIHLAPDTSTVGRRMAVLDGSFYFWGAERDLKRAADLVESLNLRPLGLRHE